MKKVLIVITLIALVYTGLILNQMGILWPQLKESCAFCERCNTINPGICDGIHDHFGVNQ